MKKFITLCLSLILASLLILPLAGCSQTDGENRMMTVELNPQVEFLLDANDKVVTVNAINDEGNYVIAKADFVGLTAEEAVNAFLKISVEDGFLLEGEINAGDNNLKISVSGDDAQKLYDDVAKKAQEYIDSIENINVNFTFNTITKEELEALVQDCMRELNVEEIQAKTQEELLKLLESSRQKTEDLLSQELKDCYYAERALEIKQAQLNAYIEAVKAQDNLGVVSATLTAVQAQFNNVLSLVNDYKAQYKQYFLDTTSEYYTKMQECLTAKKELLEARLEHASEETLKALETAYANTMTAMETCKNFATAQVKTVDDAINAAIDTAQKAVDGIVKLLGDTAADFDSIITEAIEETKTNFDSAWRKENQTYVENDYWTNLQPEKGNA